MNGLPNPPNLWRERYETLRRHVLENRHMLVADPVGVVLLSRQGLAGWMRAWPACTESTAQTPAPLPEPRRSSDCTVGPQELTRLIANMTAPHLHPQ